MTVVDDVVVPGGQRFRDHLMKRNLGRQSAGQAAHRLLQAAAFRIDGVTPLRAVGGVEAADRQARYRVHGTTIQPRRLQRVLHDRAIESRGRIAVELGWRRIDFTDRIDRRIGLVFSDHRGAAVDPGHRAAADPCARRHRKQPTVGQCDFRHRKSIVEPDGHGRTPIRCDEFFHRSQPMTCRNAANGFLCSADGC